MKYRKISVTKKTLVFLTCSAVVIGINTPIFAKKNLNIDEIREEIFHVNSHNTSLIPAADNRNVNLKEKCSNKNSIEKYTNTTHNAAKHFVSVFNDFSDKNIKTLYEIENSDNKGNLVTFGSPSSNLIARLTLGYQKIGKKGDGLSYTPKKGIKLAVRYELNAEIIKSAHDVKYRTLERNNNHNIEILANWGVRLKNGEIKCPKVIENNLAEDFLIISSLPNIFNKYALLNNQRMINFGGTHRAGTQAISLLLDSERFLRDLHKRIKKIQGEKKQQPYWQALISVKVNKKNRSSEPLSLDKIML